MENGSGLVNIHWKITSRSTSWYRIWWSALSVGTKGAYIVKQVAIAALVVVDMLSWLPVAQAKDLKLAPIYLGGVTRDMVELAKPDTTKAFRALHGGFYAHESYILAQTTGTCPRQTASPSLAATIGNFSSSPPPLAEIGFSTPLALRQLIKCNYQAIGLNPTVAIVNVMVGEASLSAWKAFVDAGRAEGLLALGPIASPNVASMPLDWSSPYWAAMKQMAAYGGALGLDTPPVLFKILGSGYTRFAQQQLAWCHANSVVCIDIISPGAHEQNFIHDTSAWMDMLSSPEVPAPVWVIENYNEGTKPGIGAETIPDSLARTALLEAMKIYRHFSPDSTPGKAD